MKTLAIFALLVLACWTVDIEEYRSHIHNQNFKPRVTEPIKKLESTAIPTTSGGEMLITLIS